MFRSRLRSSGFTIAELMIVIAILAIMATLAIPGFKEHVKRSKTSEAASQLTRLWSGSVAYFESDHAVAKQGMRSVRKFPATATTLVPGPECACQATGRCPGGGAEWRDPTWVALAFSISDPFLYKPRYTSAGSGPTSTFTAETNGDLDCDGILSSFKRSGAVDEYGEISGNKVAVIANEFE